MTKEEEDKQKRSGLNWAQAVSNVSYHFCMLIGVLGVIYLVSSCCYGKLMGT